MAFWAIPGIPGEVGHMSFQEEKKLFAAVRAGEMVVFL